MGMATVHNDGGAACCEQAQNCQLVFGGGARGQEGCELLAWTVFIMGLLLVLIIYGCSHPGCCVRQLLFFYL